MKSSASDVTYGFQKLETGFRQIEKLMEEYDHELLRREAIHHREKRKLLEKIEVLEKELDLWRTELKHVGAEIVGGER